MSSTIKYGTLETTSNIEYSKHSHNKKIVALICGLLIVSATIGFSVYWFIFRETSDENELSWMKLLSHDLKVEYYIKEIHEPRQMDVITVSTNNDTSTIIYTVGSKAEGISSETGVYALIDYTSDSKNDKILKIFDTTQYAPTSVQYDRMNNFLYITEFSITYKCSISNEEILEISKTENEYLINNDCHIWFESQYYYHHGWHITKFHPITNNLCISFGAACDICDNFEYPQGTIICFNDMDNPNLNNVTIYANGVRDSVGIDFHPLTNEMWFTDHNIDDLGDDTPDCELNRVSDSNIGAHFGFPYCHSQGFGSPYLREYGQVEFVIDPRYGTVCDENVYTAAIQPVGPHVAPNGLLFYTGNMFDNIQSEYTYQNRAIFIAQHGSHARSQKIGYRVAVVFLGEGENNSNVIDHQIFVDGWLDNVDTRGRPTNLAMLPDGSLLIADDDMNAIFRVYV